MASDFFKPTPNLRLKTINMRKTELKMPFYQTKKRKPFKISTKKIEWNRAASRADNDFKTTSKCRCSNCKLKLIWGSNAYDFDHKDNNPLNISQKNCYLVCKVCHGKHTRLGKRRVRNAIGMWTNKTIKKKVGYKKATRRKPTHKPKRKKRLANALTPNFGSFRINTIR